LKYFIFNLSFASAKLSFHVLFAVFSQEIETFKVSKPQIYQFENLFSNFLPSFLF